MSPDLTEEEMRHALFGTTQTEVHVTTTPEQEPVPEVVITASC